MTNKSLPLIIMAIAIPVATQSKADNIHGPDCSGGWPTNMTFGYLKNAGLADNSNIDFSKTRTIRLASEKIGKNLWHQVYDVVFTKKSGEEVEAVAVHNASQEECSMSGVEVFVVSKHLNREHK